MEEGQAYTMQCTAFYKGDPMWIPVMVWSTQDGIIHDVVDESSEGVLSIRVETVATPKQDGYVFRAEIIFRDYIGPLPNNRARHKPEYYQCLQYDPITVHCE